MEEPETIKEEAREKEEENQAPYNSDATKSNGKTYVIQPHQHKHVAQCPLVDSNATTIDDYIQDFEWD